MKQYSILFIVLINLSFILGINLKINANADPVSKNEHSLEINSETRIIAGIEMILVPGYNFPQFWISKYEITQQQYQSVMGDNPSFFKGDPLPVEQVSWYQAVEFCNMLSANNGYKPYYTIDKNSEDVVNKNSWIKWKVSINNGADGFRLPSSTEWEYAARAGSRSKYFWGDKMNKDYCWYENNSNGKTHIPGTGGHVL